MLALVVWTCAVGLGACGGADDGSTGPRTATARQRLTAAERGQMRRAERTIAYYCRRRALAVAEPDKTPTAGLHARAFRAVDHLIELAARKPGARVSRGVDVKLFLGDLTENLQGSNCDPALVARLEQGLATLPRRG
jgi:hypothetical protein